MRPAAERLAGTQHFCQPRIGKFQRKAGDGQHDETGRQQEMLPALRGRHAHHRPLGQAQPRGSFFDEQNAIVRRHRADGAENEQQINIPHPAVQPTAKIRAPRLPVWRDVNFAE